MSSHGITEGGFNGIFGGLGNSLSPLAFSLSLSHISFSSYANTENLEVFSLSETAGVAVPNFP